MSIYAKDLVWPSQLFRQWWMSGLSSFDTCDFLGMIYCVNYSFNYGLHCNHNSLNNCKCECTHLELPRRVPLSSKIDQLSHLESTTVSRATPLCVLCIS